MKTEINPADLPPLTEGEAVNLRLIDTQRNAADTTLDAALRHHSARAAEIGKMAEQFWDAVMAARNLPTGFARPTLRVRLVDGVYHFENPDQ